MAVNRLDRDTIINRALDLADSSVLDAKDRPSSPTIVSGALSITWLQEAIDLFAKRFPWSLNITDKAITIAENDTSFTVPSDFIIDYRNGIVLDEDQGRLLRRSLNTLLYRAVGLTASPVRGTPEIYAVQGTTIKFSPKAIKEFTGILYYYSLPNTLSGTTVPFFPDDYILVHYVWIKAQEWHRIVPIGVALQYAEDRIKDLQKAGIGLEAEPTEVELDRGTFGESQREDLFVKVTT